MKLVLSFLLLATGSLAQTSKDTNVIRLVDGKVYHVVNSTNWVTLPGPYFRGTFARTSSEGPVFRIEKQMDSKVGDAMSIWYSYDRDVLVKNYPGKKLMAGDAMPTIRVMPIKTTSDGIGVYDYGKLPQAVATNAAAKK